MILTGIAAVAGGSAAIWALVAVFVRHMASWSPRRRTVTVTRADGQSVTLDPGRFANARGEYTLLFDGGSARIGEPTAATGNVTRPVVSSTAQIPLGSVAFSPDPSDSPHAAGAFTESRIPGPSGEIPAWEYGPASTSWAIHIHGVRSNRLNALWGVSAATDAGYRSLVIAYRGAPGGPAAHRNAGLGYLEAADVAASVAYAVANGAERIVLFGWSMGASAALLTTEQSQHRELIAGLVLIAPTLSWRHIMRAGATRMGLPQMVPLLVERSITLPVAARLVGMPGRVDLDALNWVSRPKRLRVPALVIGSRGDTNVPFELVTRFAETNPGMVRVHEVADCNHGWEPNIDPNNFTCVVTTWLREIA